MCAQMTAGHVCADDLKMCAQMTCLPLKRHTNIKRSISQRKHSCSWTNGFLEAQWGMSKNRLPVNDGVNVERNPSNESYAQRTNIYQGRSKWQLFLKKVLNTKNKSSGTKKLWRLYRSFQTNPKNLVLGIKYWTKTQQQKTKTNKQGFWWVWVFPG